MPGIFRLFIKTHVTLLPENILMALVSVLQDAHNCIPEFDKDTAMFAVYDGHGGKKQIQ